MSTATTHLFPDPRRVRQRMPKRFSWIDQRALDRLQSSRGSHAYGLYLALVMLGDRGGLSYYCEKSLSHRLRINIQNLRDARSQLIDAGLIAYRCPFYQVLDLEEVSQPCASSNPTPPKHESVSRRGEHRIAERQPTEPADTEEALDQLRALREQMRAGQPHP